MCPQLEYENGSSLVEDNPKVQRVLLNSLYESWVCYNWNYFNRRTRKFYTKWQVHDNYCAKVTLSSSGGGLWLWRLSLCAQADTQLHCHFRDGFSSWIYIFENFNVFFIISLIRYSAAENMQCHEWVRGKERNDWLVSRVVVWLNVCSGYPFIKILYVIDFSKCII